MYKILLMYMYMYICYLYPSNRSLYLDPSVTALQHSVATASLTGRSEFALCCFN